MKRNPEVVYRDNKEYVVVPAKEYKNLIDIMEKYEDLRDLEICKQREAEGGELIPGSVVFAISRGKNPITAYREYRSLTQAALATMAQVTERYIIALENGERKGTPRVLKAIAKALSVDLDDIVAE